MGSHLPVKSWMLSISKLTLKDWISRYNGMEKENESRPTEKEELKIHTLLYYEEYFKLASAQRSG